MLVAEDVRQIPRAVKKQHQHISPCMLIQSGDESANINLQPAPKATVQMGRGQPVSWREAAAGSSGDW